MSPVNFFGAHIDKNEMTQDIVALESIVEHVLGRVRKELPNVSEVLLFSDNAS